MKRNMKVIQINGLRGLFLTFFVISCLIAGFVAFPAFLSMYLWNSAAQATALFPPINFGEGLLLWAIIVFSFYVFSKKRFIVSFDAKHELSDAEVSEVVSRIKAHTIKRQILKTKDFVSKPETKEETKEVSTEHSEN